MNQIANTLAALDPERGAHPGTTQQDEELLREILAGPVPAPPRRSRPHVRRVVLAGGALAAACAVAVSTIDVGGQPIGASPAAADVLHRAAQVALATSDPVVEPGQYLRLTLVEQTWGAAYEKSAHHRNVMAVGSDGKPMAYEERRTVQTWVPYDRRDVWVFRERTVPVRNASADAARLNVGEPARTWNRRGPGSKRAHTYVEYHDPAWYAALPHDPDRLLAVLGKEAPESGRLGALVEAVNPVLQSGLAPARVRAELFEALAKLPGTRIEDGVTGLGGRSGVAISYRGSNFSMIFDKATGQYVGSRATDPAFPDVPGMDADKTTWLSSMTSSVVDSAPGRP